MTVLSRLERLEKAFVAELTDEARASGAKVLEFGKLPTADELQGGNFIRPALVIDPSPGLRVVTG